MSLEKAWHRKEASSSTRHRLSQTKNPSDQGAPESFNHPIRRGEEASKQTSYASHFAIEHHAFSVIDREPSNHLANGVQQAHC
jgi:hypothetical protein